MSATPLTTIKHRPLLDGVRGYLMCGVLGFHLGGVWKLSGSWIFIDGFFLLSGYLITTLLMKEYTRDQKIDLTIFFQRRARRLAPALLAMLFGVFLIAFLLGGPKEFSRLRWDGISALFYIANWRFIISEQSYFASFDLSPLRHAWTLAIEEQFYLVWPVVFLVLARISRFDRRFMLIILTILLLVSAWSMRQLALGDVDLSRAYYGTDSRGQGLIVGAIMGLILWHDRWDTPHARKIASWIGTIACLLVLAMAVFLGDSDRYIYTSGGFLIILTIMAVFVFGCARVESGPLQWLFGNKIAVHLGSISYSFYLWHWPVIVFMTPERIDLPQFQLDLARIAVTFLMTETSYWFLEKPIHERRLAIKRPGLTLFIAFAACLAFILVAFPASDSAQAARTPTDDASRIAADGPRVVLLGDSLAGILMFAVPKDYPYLIEGFSQGHCDLIGDTIYIGESIETADPACKHWPRRWTQALNAQLKNVTGQADVVLVTLGLRQLFDIADNGNRLAVGSAEWEQQYRAAVKRAMNIIRDATEAPVLWLDVPCYRWEAAGTAGEEYDAQRLSHVNRELAAVLSTDPSFELVPYAEWVCGGPGGTESDRRIRPDGAHLHWDSVDEFWSRFIRPRLDHSTQPR